MEGWWIIRSRNSAASAEETFSIFFPVLALKFSQSSVVVLASYFLGCVTFGYYLVRWRTGQDIRQLGSGSVGARNVGRQLGIAGFTFTLLFDFVKGLLAVGLTRIFTDYSLYMLLALFAVVMGHIWPLQLRCKGGKGIATSIGGLLVFDPRLVLTLVILFVLIFGLLRRTTLSCLITYAFIPMAGFFWGYNVWEIIGLGLFAGIILFAHRSNLSQEILSLRTRPADNRNESSPPRYE